VPNACNGCHVDKTYRWADEQITKWYGPGRSAHYGTIIDAGNRRLPQAQKDLVQLAADPLYPVIVRSTALSLLADYPAEKTIGAYELALMDDEALIRRTAIDHLEASDPKRLATLLGPMLYDPVKAVRIEAARRLAEKGDLQLDAPLEKILKATVKEYVAAMEYSADFSFGRYNLGNLYAALKQPDKAIRNYLAAIRIDNLFYPAKVNLAMLYNQEGQNKKAETLLRQVTAAHPELYDIHYSLGLLLAEEKKYAEAAGFLKQAATGMPQRARVHYNLGLLLQHLKQDSEAEAALLQAQEIEPDNLDYLYALADFYLKRNKLAQARSIAQAMVKRHPGQRIGHDILKYIENH
jgi:Tfp pilus assembly protein PilF